MSLEVIYYDLPVTDSITYRAQGQPFCAVRSLNDKRNPEQTPYEPIITLEPDSWALDGSRVPLRAYAPPPFWGREISDETGELATPATVEVTVQPRCTASGVTLIFWEETHQWCSRIRLSWYQGDTLLAEETAYPDSPRLVVQKWVEDFDRLVLSLEKTSQPYRYPRLTYLLLGQELTFRQDSLVSVKQLTEYDPTGCTLSADTVTVEVCSELDIRAQENQPLELYRGGKRLAACYLTGSRRTGVNSFVLSAQSVIGVMEEQVVLNMFEGVTPDQAMFEIMGNIPWEVDGSFAHESITGYLPKCTRREALQQLAFVLGARVEAAEGTVRLLPRQTEVTGAFLPEDIFSGAQLETGSVLVRLEVTAHSYTTSGEERLLLDNHYVSGENVIIVMDTPCYEYRVEGGELLGFGTGTVEVTANGYIRLYGNPYTHTGVIHSRSMPGSGRVLAVDSATLVNGDNVASVMDMLTETAKDRQKLTQDVVLEDQYAGQRVTTPTPWGSTLEGVITAVEAHLTPTGQTATVTIQGRETN